MTSAAAPAAVVVGGGDRNKYRSSLTNSFLQSLIGGDGGESIDSDDFLGDVVLESEEYDESDVCLRVVVLGLRLGNGIIPLLQDEDLASHLACGQRDEEEVVDDCEEDDDDECDDIDRFNSSFAAGTLARSNMISMLSCC